jgi:hypothetical protein
MPIYERLTEDLLREADKLMTAEFSNPRNNFRIALDKLEMLQEHGKDIEIYHVLKGKNEGGILLVPKEATKLEKAF